MDRFRCALVLRGRGVTIPSALEWHGAQLPLIQGVPELVADGVYVIADHRVPIVPNVGIVVGQRAALVIDTGLGQSNGGYVLEQARSVAGGRPMYVATTHVDPGHGFGMQAFNGNARILFSQAQRVTERQDLNAGADLDAPLPAPFADERPEWTGKDWAIGRRMAKGARTPGGFNRLHPGHYQALRSGEGFETAAGHCDTNVPARVILAVRARWAARL